MTRRPRPASRQQQSYETRLIIMESKQNKSSCLGGKSWEVAQRAWLAFCIASPHGPSLGAPRPTSKEWLHKRGRGRDGREVAKGQTGDVESQGRQFHKDGHGAAGEGGEDGGGLEAATMKSGGVRELGSSSWANLRLRDDMMKTCIMFWLIPPPTYIWIYLLLLGRTEEELNMKLSETWSKNIYIFLKENGGDFTQMWAFYIF